MPDGSLTINAGQGFTAYMTMEAASGNYTATSASYSITDSLGNPVSGLSNQPGILLVAGPAPSVEASFSVASTSLPVGNYFLTLSLTASDGVSPTTKTQVIALTVAAAGTPGNGPVPLLYEPLTVSLFFGLTVFTIYREEDIVTLMATVADANPNPTWDLTNATIKFHMRSTGAGVGSLLVGTGRVVDAINRVLAYDFVAADIVALSAGSYVGAFVVTFPLSNGITVSRQFGTINILVNNDPS